MHKPDPVETILARLMPPALSESGQQSMEAMLDELAGTAAPANLVRPADAPWGRRVFAGGIAAALTAALVVPWAYRPAPVSWAANAPVREHSAGLVLMGESDRVEGMTDAGWQEDSEGAPMQATRLSVVEENSLLDEQTGIVMQVSEPREEIFLMPVSTF